MRARAPLQVPSGGRDLHFCEATVGQSPYSISDTSGIVTPALVVFPELVAANIAEMIRVAGAPDRLRPHCKTHKMREVVEMQLVRGIRKQKCATIAEAEMLADAGVKDILWAYNPVGPNIGRVVRFLERFPDVRLGVTADHAGPVEALNAAMVEDGKRVDVLLDIDSGQHRTGLPADGAEARSLYKQIASSKGLIAGGLHLYDGQNHQRDFEERKAAVTAVWNAAAALRDDLTKAGLSVPRIVAGGTGSFPIFAAINDPVIELSPGTLIFHDWGYSQTFPELKFTPAAVMLTRVVSRPTSNRVTFDLGYKAVASDPPAGNRLMFPDLPDAKAVLQNEEHLVVETDQAERFQPGDELVAIPRHICPTCALHKEAYVVEGGRVVGSWKVAARDRVLTI
jgi:D-serine deaminase-like pyridoxal phosphate-dependent protein